MMRTAVSGDTAASLLNVGASLGVSCGICQHRVVIDLTKLPQDRDLWRLRFKCSGCGERRTVFKYILVGDADLKAFEAGEMPRSTNHQYG